MKSSSYFEERSERRMKKMHDKATKCMSKVNKAYDDSLERLKKEIDHIADGSSLTEKIDYDRYKELLQIYNTTKDKRVKAEAKRLIKENSASYRIQRKEALSKAIEIEKLKQVDSQLSLGGKHLKNVYSSVLNDLGGARVSKKYLDEVLNHEWAGSNFSKRVWHNQDVLAKSLESNLLQSFASGKSNKQIADELEYHTNLGRYAANRLIRTETSYMVNSADLESSKQRGIKAKKFQANLDKRTSKICREHNQKVILIDDIKIGENAPPLHPFCRSFLSDVLEGWDYETEEELMALVSENNVDSTEEVKYTTGQINNVLENYVSGDGMWINSYLRNPTEFGNLTEDEKEYLSIMDYALKNDIKETTLYRSVDARAVFGNITDSEYDDLKSQLLYGNDNKKALELINSVKGKEIVEKGFMSTTTEQRIALDWGDFSGSDKPIVLELKTPKGTKGKNLHFLDFEDDPQREVLLARNTKYKINSIETKEGQIYLKAEVINSDKSIQKGYNINELKLAKLNQAFNETDFKEYKDIVSKNENIKKLYSEYGDLPSKIEVVKKGACYNPVDNSLKLRINSKEEIESGLNKFSVVAHEYGHFFDANIKLNNLSYKELEMYNKVLPKSLTPNYTLSGSDEFINALREDKKILKQRKFEDLKNELIKFNASNGIQDAIDGMFEGGSYRIRWGHGESYYDRKYNNIKNYQKIVNEDYVGNIKKGYIELGYEEKNIKVKSLIRDFETASEAWANITSAITCGGEELKFIKKYLPNSYNELLKILKEV